MRRADGGQHLHLVGEAEPCVGPVRPGQLDGNGGAAAPRQTGRLGRLRRRARPGRGFGGRVGGRRREGLGREDRAEPPARDHAQDAIAWKRRARRGPHLRRVGLGARDGAGRATGHRTPITRRPQAGQRVMRIPPPPASGAARVDGLNDGIGPGGVRSAGAPKRGGDQSRGAMAQASGVWARIPPAAGRPRSGARPLWRERPGRPSGLDDPGRPGRRPHWTTTANPRRRAEGRETRAPRVPPPAFPPPRCRSRRDRSGSEMQRGGEGP